MSDWVKVVRFVRTPGNKGYFFKVFNLPVVAIGIGIVIHKDSDPLPIEDVFYNYDGEIVAILEQSDYGDKLRSAGLFCKQEEADEQWEYEIEGWTPTDGYC